MGASSRFIMELNNCYYVPAISRNIISASCLMAEGYKFIIENNGCSIFLNEMFYGYAPVLNVLFILIHNKRPYVFMVVTPKAHDLTGRKDSRGYNGYPGRTRSRTWFPTR